MSIKNLQAAKKRSGDRTPTEDVAIKVVSYSVADPKNPDVSKDFFTGVLMHDALGMQAEFDADGNPLTEVKVRLRPDNQQRKHARAEVAQMQNGDKRQKVHPGGIIQADRSYIDRDGFVNTAWVRGLVRKPEDIENGSAMVLAGVMASIQPERKSKDGQAFQYRFVADPAAAVRVGNVDEMRAAMINALQDHEWGSTGFIIRGIEAENVDERASQRWMRKWDNEAKAFTTPEATVDEFFAKNPVWVETVAGTQTGSTEVFEVIPMIRIRTGRDSLPSMKFDGKGGRDEADSYRFSTEDEDGKPRNSYGWAVSNLTILRGDGENKSWFGTVGNPTSRGALIYDDAEIVTGNLPEPTIAALDQVAAGRRNAGAPERQASNGEDMQFGDNEPSGPNP